MGEGKLRGARWPLTPHDRESILLCVKEIVY